MQFHLQLHFLWTDRWKPMMHVHIHLSSIHLFSMKQILILYSLLKQKCIRWSCVVYLVRLWTKSSYLSLTFPTPRSLYIWFADPASYWIINRHVQGLFEPCCSVTVQFASSCIMTDVPTLHQGFYLTWIRSKDKAYRDWVLSDSCAL